MFRVIVLFFFLFFQSSSSGCSSDPSANSNSKEDFTTEFSNNNSNHHSHHQKKGLLWQQRDKLFSRWKERYFILTKDYFHCFKRASSKMTEMGGFIFKVKCSSTRSGFNCSWPCVNMVAKI